MKNGKRPTRRHKMAIGAAKLDPDKWLVIKACDGQLHIVHRDKAEIKVIPA